MHSVRQLKVIGLWVVAGLLALLWAVGCTPTPGANPELELAASEEEAATSDEESAAEQVGESSEFETLDSTAFAESTTIDNPYFPLTPGTQFIYEGTTVEGEEIIDHRLEFTVTGLTKEIDGVETVVAWILDYSDGELVEKEVSFYAQDDSGAVWYLGEHPEEYEEGDFIDAPTWIHGVGDARAGIAMTAEPQRDAPSYSQGWSPEVGFADRGQVAEVDQETCTPVDCYTDVIVVEEFTEAEPNAFQLKFYASGVGHVRVGWRGEDAQQEELELVAVEQLSPEALAEIHELALELEAHAYEISPDVYGATEPMIIAEP